MQHSSFLTPSHCKIKGVYSKLNYIHTGGLHTPIVCNIVGVFSTPGCMLLYTRHRGVIDELSLCGITPAPQNRQNKRVMMHAEDDLMDIVHNTTA